MKTIFTITILLASVCANAQYYPSPAPHVPSCRQVMVCNPGQVCQFVMVCD